MLNELLQEHYDFIDSKFPRHIMAIFARGGVVYGFGNENTPFDSLAIVLPSFESIVRMKKPVRGEFNYLGRTIKYVDVRIYVNELNAGMPSTLETLYSTQSIINPQYESIFNQFFVNNREKMAFANPLNTLYFMRHDGIAALTKHYLTMRDIFYARKAIQFLDDYMGNKPFLECLIPQDKHVFELLDKMYKADNVDKRIINNKAKELLEKLKQYDTLRKDEITNNIAVGTEPALAEILKVSLLIDLGVETEQKTLEGLMEYLTHRELEALKEIYKRIGLKGKVSIKKLCEDTKLSRPVYQNALNKLREYGIITTYNHGQAGMEIIFNVPAIVSFMEGI